MKEKKRVIKEQNKISIEEGMKEGALDLPPGGMNSKKSISTVVVVFAGFIWFLDHKLIITGRSSGVGIL